jgi:hypothetical protein
MTNLKETNDWLLLSESLRGSWCAEASHRLGETFGDEVQVELRLPTEEDAVCAWAKNTRLNGELTLSCREETVERQVPIPFDGTFIDSGLKSPRALVWENWLVERPGVRRVRRVRASQHVADEFWLAFPDGSHLAIPCSEHDKKLNAFNKTLRDRADRLFHHFPFSPLWTKSDYPQTWFRDALAAIPSGRNSKTQRKDAILALLNELVLHASEFSEPTDADDLGHRYLMTFPRWLIFRLCQLAAAPGKTLKDRFTKTPKDPSKKEPSPKSIVPIRPLVRFGMICPVKPINSVELMARITGVRRYRFQSENAGRIPAEYRQNHPSFDGRICPLESPESELVGLALQLARGACVSADGTIVPATGTDTLDRIGWGAALIPFFHHNDGARDMMGAKNLRQAVPVEGCEPPVVTTGAEAPLADRVARLVRVGIRPDFVDAAGSPALGRDLLVAYMPWDGWNVDDAVVIRRGAADWLAIREHKVFAKELTEGATYNVHDGIENGCELREGDVLATIENPDGKKWTIAYGDSCPGTLVRAPQRIEKNVWVRGKKYVQYFLRYEIVERLSANVGDKLMGRHGNKGVVGLVLADDEMPKLSDGRPVDILVNPHGVLSRMNPGQLLETHVGWLLHAGFSETDLLAADSPRVPVGNPEAKLDHDRIRVLLEKTGLNRNGAVRLVLPGGRTDNPVVVGYEHFVRLHHVPALKAQARRGGEFAAYSSATRQPVRGRHFGGGQRLGEMEIWALAAHGANAFLDEALGVKSDAILAKNGTEDGSGFSHLFRDWLRALCVDVVFNHGTMTLRPLLGRKEIISDLGFRPEANGGWIHSEEELFDPKIFGKGEAGDETWGCIELPTAVQHPWMPDRKIEILPVLPLRYRRPHRQTSPADFSKRLNRVYSRLLTRINSKRGGSKDALQRCVDAVFKILEERLDKKDGLLRQFGLGRRVDRSFRTVIAPDPTLEWNQAGVPATILWELLGDRINQWYDAKQRGTSVGSIFDTAHQNTGEECRPGNEDRTSVPFHTAAVQMEAGFSWKKSDRPAKGGQISFKGHYPETAFRPLDPGELLQQVRAYLSEHPETLIVLNRQPSLHKYSFQAFHPVASDPRDGEVLRISPLCCKGFAADFDGDEMVGHIPLSKEAADDAAKMLPENKNNLISDATGNPTLHFDRDFVTGVELLVRAKPDWFREDVDQLDSCCRNLFDQFRERLGKKDGSYVCGEFGKALVDHLCKDHAGQEAVRLAGAWARLAWKACSASGFSFGFYDLLDLADAAAGDSGQLDNLLQSARKDNGYETAGRRAVATMVLTGANGQKQLPQIVCRRGKLEGLENANREINSSLVGGMDWRDLFDASWNARRSMCDKKLGTAKAGDLTRRLVFALWPRQPSSNGRPSGTGGLVAAQSIGERGTQLAMQSFHAGTRALDIEASRRLLLKGIQIVEIDHAPPKLRLGDTIALEVHALNDDLTLYPVKVEAIVIDDNKHGGRKVKVEIDFVKNKNFNAFHAAVTENGKNEYAALARGHFKLLWEWLLESADKEKESNTSIPKQDGFAQLLLSQQTKRLRELVRTGESLSLDSPFAKVLFNLFKEANPEQSGGL